MPTWVAVLIAVLALVPTGTLLILASQKRATFRSEQKEGAAAVTPIRELISALPVPLSRDTFFITGVALNPRSGSRHLNPRSGSRHPAATRESADATKKRLANWNERWADRRQQLNVYADAHPDEQVRHLSNQLVTAVDQLRDALNSLEWKSGLDVYDVAKARHDEAATIAAALLNLIRGTQRD